MVLRDYVTENVNQFSNKMYKKRIEFQDCEFIGIRLILQKRRK